MPRTQLLVLTVLTIGWASPAWSQNKPAAGNQPLPTGKAAAPNLPAKEPAGPKKIQINASVRPAFKIDPIVNRIETRPGRIVPFEFGITCDGKAVELEIIPIALTQDETGAIGPNTLVPAPPELKMESTGTASLTPAETFVVRGRVVVPNTQSTFHTYGILVRDAGQLNETPTGSNDNAPRVGIRFVTQYLLRCDISVTGVKSENASKLKVESANLVEVDGSPEARVYVSNPTDAPIEFNLNTQIRHNKEGETRPSFPLWMPVRANSDEPEKFTARILPGARIRMVSPLDAAIYPGEYYMESALMWDHRVLSKTGFPVIVAEGSFPAVAVSTSQVGPAIEASPSQIELSLQRGGERSQIVVLQNTGSQATELELIAEGVDGTAANWFTVRPATASLANGSTRKVAVTFAPAGDPNSHRYGRLRVKSKTADGNIAESTSIVVAGFGRTPLPPASLSATQLVWDEKLASPAFVVDVKNEGARHVPVEALLILGDEAARPLEIRGGFGKWILPGSTEKVRLNAPQDLKAGHYTARVLISAGKDVEPIVQQLEFDLGKSPNTP